MNKSELISNKCSIFNRISNKYSEFSGEINSNLLEELTSMASTFEQDAKQAQNENRVLRIGIIGQIKRGKSSFLNSLLFNGQDILPKAATPMTAALTKISYSEEPSASVEFYTRPEWEKVKSTAAKAKNKQQQYQTDLITYNEARKKRDYSVGAPILPIASDEEKACVELLNMMQVNNIDMEEYLDTVQTIAGVTSNADLVDKLNQYVGAEGKYTPIVKSTKLKLNVSGLKDIEVVDTPGMNDPIVSRGRRTQEFIGQCDVIFFLSYCGQFLDMQDMGLLAQNIPSKGIEEIVLVGSIFDGALTDEGHNYDNIQTALPAITAKLNRLARDNVNTVCQQDAGSEGSQSSLMATLEKSLPPTFISARCFDLANKLSDDSNPELSEEEAHSLKQLNGMFENFEFNAKVLKFVANFSSVEKKVENVRDKKDSIMADRFDNLFKGATLGMLKKLEQAKEDVSYKYKQLSEGDLEQLALQHKKILNNIRAGKIKVNAVFQKYSIQAEKSLRALKYTIEQDAMSVKQVQSQSSNREESYQVSHQVDDSGWMPWNWNKTRTVRTTKYRTVNYTYASVNEAVDKLEGFVSIASKQLYKASAEAINLTGFRNDIKAAVKDMFDFSDDSFDPEMILIPLNLAVERITIPNISLDMTKHIQTIRQQFDDGDQVEDNEMSRLRQEQGRVVSLVLGDIAIELDAAVNGLIAKLDQEEKKFLPSLTEDLNESVEQLSADLQSKEQRLSRYSEVLTLLDDDVNTFKQDQFMSASSSELV
jgi:hypothetical protein